MNIIVDTMGGDNGSRVAVEGAIKALSSIDKFATITLCGNEKEIIEELSKYEYDKNRIIINPTTEVVTGEDSPTRVIKQKPNSSLVVGLHMLKEDKGDVMISSANTGALFTGAALIIKKIKGVDRAALAPVLKGANGEMIMLLDAGANAQCKPENLVQFALMGSIYMNTIQKVKNPKVGLINIGSESHKGDELRKSVYKMLEETKDINFVGNVEGNEVPLGKVNVAVTDGFTGNILLKTMEGMGKMVSMALTEESYKNIKTKIGALLFKKFKGLKEKLDSSEYGGAIYLGIEKPVIKVHGSSNARAYEVAIIQADNIIKNKTIDKIAKSIVKFSGSDLVK